MPVSSPLHGTSRQKACSPPPVSVLFFSSLPSNSSDAWVKNTTPTSSANTHVEPPVCAMHPRNHTPTPRRTAHTSTIQMGVVRMLLVLLHCQDSNSSPSAPRLLSKSPEALFMLLPLAWAILSCSLQCTSTGLSLSRSSSVLSLARCCAIGWLSDCHWWAMGLKEPTTRHRGSQSLPYAVDEWEITHRALPSLRQLTILLATLYSHSGVISRTFIFHTLVSMIDCSMFWWVDKNMEVTTTSIRAVKTR
jgi:hypothetical protein